MSNLCAVSGGLVAARIVSEEPPDLPDCHNVRPTLEDVYLYRFADSDQVVVR